MVDVLWYGLCFQQACCSTHDSGKHQQLDLLFLIGGAISAVIFLTAGLASLTEMRFEYFTFTSEVFEPSRWLLYIRYIGYGFLVGLMYLMWQTFPKTPLYPKLRPAVVLGYHLAALIVLSAEMLHIGQIFAPENAFLATSEQLQKVGFSILWGVYGLFLMGVGFRQKQSFLRIGAIVLMGITILKVFVFDMIGSSVGSKVIVFVSLGVLLLLMAFLYQRFRHIFEGEEEKG